MCCIVFFSSSNVFASSDAISPESFNRAEQAEVDELLDELVYHRLLKQNQLNYGLKGYDNLEDEIMKKLNAKGVRYATQEEINTISKENLSTGVGTFNASPPTWGPYAGTDMLNGGQKTIKVNGQTHTIWIFYAIPKASGGAPLSRFYDSVDLNQNTSFSATNFAYKVLEIYLQKAFGAYVKELEWVPWELFWPTQNVNFTSVNRYDLSVSVGSRMKYVWQKSNNDWNLKASSNNVTLAETHLIRGIKNGGVDHDTKTKQNVIYADEYTNVETLAVTNWSYQSFAVGQITYKNIHGQTARSFYPPYAANAADLI